MRVSQRLVLYLVLVFLSCNVRAEKPAVLVFTFTSGFRHKSIPEGVSAIQQLGRNNKFNVDTTESVLAFTDENLKKYSAIIFLNCTGTGVFNNAQKSAIQRFVRSGKGVVGVHAAADFSYEWEWYGKMMGAYFESHPKIQEAKLIVEKPEHPIVKMIPNAWLHTDEWYNFKSVSKNIDVLLSIDEKSYTGGKMGKQHPISWIQEFEGGKIFYTELGHTPETYKNEIYLDHLLQGIKWTMIKNERF